MSQHAADLATVVPVDRGPYRGRHAADVVPIDRARSAERADRDVVAIRTRRVHPAGRARTRPSPSGPGPAAPGPADLAVLLVRAREEVLAGRRPYPQLEALLAPSLARRVALELRRTRGRIRPPCAIRRVRVSPPTPTGAYEITVVTERSGRVGAVAIRLERHRGVWRATEMTCPEDGYAPLPTASDPRPTTRCRDAFDEAALEAEMAVASAPLTRRRGSA